MRTLAVSSAVLALVAAAAQVRAEKVDLSPDRLRETATHVVVGTVKAVYSRTVREGDWQVTRHVAEVAVSEVEKGEGIAQGGLVYARYWHRTWAGAAMTMPPSTAGHRGLPAEGATLRVFLARNAYDGFTEDNRDGGFNVIGANGFQPFGTAAPAK
jgi:hypothetical protein